MDDERDEAEGAGAMSDNYRVLDEMPRCCATCCWFVTYPGEPGYCDHPDLPAMRPAESRGVCDGWEEQDA